MSGLDVSRGSTGIEPEDTVQPMPRVRDRRPMWVVLGVFLTSLIVLTATSWDDISQPRYENGDFAANSILIDQATSLELLHGNYSRTGFYHPGPALLYVQAGGQILFHDLLGLVPTPYNAHLLSIFILNSAMLALAAGILYRASGSIWSVLLLLSVSLAYAVQFGTLGLGGLLVSTSMPHVYVWPFLLLVTSSASVAVGRGQDLWIFVLAAGLLVHGHVSFVLPLIVFSALVAAVWVRKHKRDWLRSIPLSSRIASLAVLGVFLLPLVLQLVLDFPGQFGSYVRYLRETDLPAKTIVDAARFVAQYWGLGAASAVLIPLLFIAGFASVAAAEPPPRREFLGAIVWACLLASATTVVYAYSGVDDLAHTYLALFYVSVPILVWTALGTSLLERDIPGRRVLLATTGAALAVGSVLLLMQPNAGSIYAGSEVGLVYDAADMELPDDSAIAISLQEFDDWVPAIGLLEQARRDGRDACAEIPAGILEIVFTEEVACAGRSGDRVELLVTGQDMPPTPTAVPLYRSNTLHVWRIDG